jgi:hypothetical protein
LIEAEINKVDRFTGLTVQPPDVMFNYKGTWLAEWMEGQQIDVDRKQIDVCLYLQMDCYIHMCISK